MPYTVRISEYRDSTGNPIIGIFSSTLDSYYEQTINYLHDKYFTHPTHLSSEPLTEYEKSRIAFYDGMGNDLVKHHKNQITIQAYDKKDARKFQRIAKDHGFAAAVYPDFDTGSRIGDFFLAVGGLPITVLFLAIAYIINLWAGFILTALVILIFLSWNKLTTSPLLLQIIVFAVGFLAVFFLMSLILPL